MYSNRSFSNYSAGLPWSLNLRIARRMINSMNSYRWRVLSDELTWPCVFTFVVMKALSNAVRLIESTWITLVR